MSFFSANIQTSADFCAIMESRSPDELHNPNAICECVGGRDFKGVPALPRPRRPCYPWLLIHIVKPRCIHIVVPLPDENRLHSAHIVAEVTVRFIDKYISIYTSLENLRKHTILYISLTKNDKNRQSMTKQNMFVSSKLLTRYQKFYWNISVSHFR